MGQKTLGTRQGYCRDCTAALMNGPLGGAQQSALSPLPSDETTNETTSHLTRLSKDDNLIIGYSHSTGETTNHSTRLSKIDNQLAGYRQASNASQVAGYAFC